MAIRLPNLLALCYGDPLAKLYERMYLGPTWANHGDWGRLAPGWVPWSAPLPIFVAWYHVPHPSPRKPHTAPTYAC